MYSTPGNTTPPHVRGLFSDLSSESPSDHDAQTRDAQSERAPEPHAGHAGIGLFGDLGAEEVVQEYLDAVLDPEVYDEEIEDLINEDDDDLEDTLDPAVSQASLALGVEGVEGSKTTLPSWSGDIDEHAFTGPNSA